MRKILILICCTYFLSGCVNPEAEHKKFNYQLDSLTFVLNSRDSTINDLLSSFNEIQNNLDSVAAKQNLVSFHVNNKNKDLKKNTKEMIIADITVINQIIEQNKIKIDDLSSKLNRTSNKITEFRKMIIELNNQILQKNIESRKLNDRLNELSIQIIQLQKSVDDLSSNTARQDEVIATQTAAMHTAYYIVGRRKELSNKNVIDKTGGLLGIGKTSKLNPDFDNANFMRIDYTETVIIPIHSKQAEVITTHPKSSYMLNEDKNGFTHLRITNPAQFWSRSKYLVIVTN